MYIHADLVYSHAGYDITSYFRSAFIEVQKKTSESAASDIKEINIKSKRHH